MSKRSSNSPDPHSDRRDKAIPQLLRLAGFSLAGLLLLFLLHLALVGIPDPLTQRINRSLRQRGIPLHIASITLSPHRGFVLREVQLYSPLPDDLEPVLQTDKLYVLAWPDNWLAPLRNGWNLKIRCRQIAVSTGCPWSRETRQILGTVEKTKADLHVTPDRLEISRGELIWGGSRLQVAGEVSFAEEQRPLGADRVRDLRNRVLLLADALADIRFDQPPEISIRFSVPAPPQTPSLSAVLNANGFRRNGIRIDRLHAAATLSNRVFRIDPLLFAQTDEEQLTLSGSFSLTNQSAHCTVKNTLPARDLPGVLPDAAAAPLDRLEISLPGDAEFVVELGPAPLPQLLSTLSIDLQNADVLRRDIALKRLSGRLTRSGDQLKLRDIRAEANGGPLEGSASVNLATKAWSTSLNGTVLPGPIGNLLVPAAKEWIDRFDFTRQPPQIHVELSGTKGIDSIRMTGNVTGADFTCAGLPFDTIEMGMSYSNLTFTLSPLQLTHGDRQFHGTISTDFDHKLSRFDAVSEFPPADIGQIIAPGHPTVLSRFNFNGPLQIKADGRVDYSGGTNHAFLGQIDAQNVSMDGIPAASFSSRIEGRGPDLVFTNATAALFGGKAEGSAVFDLHTEDPSMPYQMNLQAANMDLPQILKVITTNNSARTTGRLSGQFQFTADGQTEFWKSARGTGTVEIVDGRLAELPILGEFSKIIRTTFPAFSIFSLTTLYSEFELRDEQLQTEDLQLGGTLLTIRSRGSYSPGQGLNFLLNVEPLRQTRTDKEWYHIHLWSMDMLKQSTAPLFNLLEFRLRGSLEEPEWKMITFP
jgi:hypothetical protein